MKKIAFALCALLPVSALANPVQKQSPGAAQVYGDGSAAAASTSRSHAKATGGNASATGGAGGHASATGGAGGNASATGGVGGGATVSVNGAGGSYGGGSARAPDVVVPGGGGFDCPTVGFGASGAGLGGGGGFGPSWISPDCNARKLAELLAMLGYKDQAIGVLRSHFPEVDKQFPAAAAVAQPAPKVKPDYCAAGRGWTVEAISARYPECR